MTKAAVKTRKSCRVCSHPLRHEIEAARVAGCSLDAIAAKFGVHRDSVWRHQTNYVSAAQKASYLADVDIADVAAKAAKIGGSVIDGLALIRATVLQQMLLAAQCGDGHRTAVLAGRATEVSLAIGKFSGELSELRSLTVNNNVNFVNSPAFTRLERMLLDRLKRHPAALAEVLEGLAELEGEEGGSERRQPPMITVEAANSHAA